MSTGQGTTPHPLIPQDPEATPTGPPTNGATALQELKTTAEDLLSEFEQAVIADFGAHEHEQRETESEGGTEGAGAGDGEDEEGTTDLGGGPSAPAGPAQPAQEGTDPSAPGSAPSPQPDASGATTAPPAAADDAAPTYLGRPRSDVEAALQAYDYFRSLPPQALQAVDAYLSGGYVLVPAASAGEGAPATPPSPAPTPDDDDYLDPAVAKRINDLQSELQSLKQTTQQQVQSQQQAQEQELLAAIDRASAEFSTSRQLSDAEREQVMETAARLGTMQTGMALYPTDYTRAVTHALDLAYLSRPEFQQREIDRRAQQQIEEQRALAERKSRAGAVTSAPGSVTKPTPTPPHKMTTQERDAAMSEEIAAAMANR